MFRIDVGNRKFTRSICILMVTALQVLDLLTLARATPSNACVEYMRQRGHYDFDDMLTPAERPLFSWISREEEHTKLRHDRNIAAIPSLCEQVLLKYPRINSPDVSHEMRVRMIVDYVFRVIPWRERGVEDRGIDVYEGLAVNQTTSDSNEKNVSNAEKSIHDLAEAFLFYESGAGSVVCGGYAWMLAFTLHYFGYWAVVLDSKFKNSYFADDEGNVVNGHQTVMARVCDESKRECKWAHLDPSIGSIIVHKSSQEMASFFQVIESFYALQSNSGFEVVPAWTEASGSPQARSAVPENIFTDPFLQPCQHFQEYWTLLEECSSSLQFTTILGRKDARLVSAPRTMRNMVSHLVLPNQITTWWFYSLPAGGAQNIDTGYGGKHCLEQKIVSAKPPCFEQSGCVSMAESDIRLINSDLMTKIECPESGSGSSRNDGKMRYYVKDAELRYFIWLMRCSNMAPRVFAGPDGFAVQNCRDQVQSSSNQNPVTRPEPYRRYACVVNL